MAVTKLEQSEKALKARTWTIFHLSGSDFGCGVDFGRPGAIRWVVSRRRTSTPRPNSQPEKRNIFQPRDGSANCRAQLRLIEFSGWPRTACHNRHYIANCLSYLHGHTHGCMREGFREDISIPEFEKLDLVGIPPAPQTLDQHTVRRMIQA